MIEPVVDVAANPCCVCSAVDSELLWTNVWPEHGYPGEFSMRRCRQCGLLFNSPRLDDHEIANLYGKNYYFFLRRDARELRRMVPIVQRTVALVEDRIGERRCLDIGCGRGYLPAVLRKLGWEAHGVEISPEAAEYARRQFGLNVFTGTIEQYSASGPAETFPLVTAIDVLEHVPSPRGFFDAAARAVRPGGYLIIDTPNGGARNTDDRGAGWGGFNPFHIYLFSVPAVSRLLEERGFRVEHAFSYGNRRAARAPLSRKLRDRAARALKRVGLIRPAAAMYFRLKALGPAHPRANGVLDEVVHEVRSCRPFTETPDATDELAPGARGDNIVVIARKAAPE